MKLFFEKLPDYLLKQGTAATIGNFDGVHLGHQALLKQLKKEAHSKNLPLLVVLFEPQPNEYIYKHNSPPRIFSLREKLEILRKLGIDYVCSLHFNEKLLNTSAEKFVEEYLFERFNIKYALLGEDFRFGFNRAGDIDLLRKMGLEVQVFSDFYFKNERVSSTKIREALLSGNFSLATSLLGHEYFVCGRVINGDGRGSSIGIPTANFKFHMPQRALSGVFCVKIKLKDVKDVKNDFFGVANIGVRPTFGITQKRLEVHILDFNKIIYGKMAQITFVKKLREEKKFSSPKELVEQIHMDIIASKNYFNLMSISNE